MRTTPRLDAIIEKSRPNVSLKARRTALTAEEDSLSSDTGGLSRDLSFRPGRCPWFERESATLRRLELVWRLFRTRPLPNFCRLLIARFFPQWAYRQWIRRHEPTAAELAGQTRYQWPFMPSFLLVYLGSDAEKIASFPEQTYRRFERKSFAEALARLADSAAEYVAFVGPGVRLAPFALFEVVRALNRDPSVDLLYGDEDSLTPTGVRCRPQFKPDWSPDLLRSHNYIGPFFVARRERVVEALSSHIPKEPVDLYDLLLRITERTDRILRVPKILAHCRTPASVSEQCLTTQRQALASHLARQGVSAEVERGPVPGTFHVSYTLPREPLVSVLIANRDQAALLARCVESLWRSAHRPVEVLIVENHSREPATFALYNQLRQRHAVRVLHWDQPFNYAAVHNWVAEQARGEVLLLLNNDVEARDADWLERLLEHALRPEVGAVGAKLYYPNGTIQHGGVIIGLGGIAGHAHHLARASSPGYANRLMVAQNFSAVTAACLMLRREVFRKVGGFDERFALAFNDVDLCLRLRERGYRIVWTPRAELIHHESRTRGRDDTRAKQARYQAEVHHFRQRWNKLLQQGDPYYSPHLSLDWEDFAIRL